jgi:hypothetical protein
MALKIFFLQSLQLPQYHTYLHLLFVKFTGETFLKGVFQIIIFMIFKQQISFLYLNFIGLLQCNKILSVINSMDWDRTIPARKPPQYFEFGPASQDPFSFCQIQLAPIQCVNIFFIAYSACVNLFLALTQHA